MQAALKEQEPIDDQTLITGEDLYKSGNSQRSELIEGKLNIMSPTGFLHGRIEVTIARKLGDSVERKKIGHVLGGEVGIISSATLIPFAVQMCCIFLSNVWNRSNRILIWMLPQS